MPIFSTSEHETVVWWPTQTFDFVSLSLFSIRTIPFSEVVDGQLYLFKTLSSSSDWPSTSSCSPTPLLPAPKLYLDGQSTQNIMRTPSKQQLVNTFGAHNHDNVIIQVLEKGVLQGASELKKKCGKEIQSTSSNRISAWSLDADVCNFGPLDLCLITTRLSTAQKEGYSTTNDSKSSGNQLAGGARNGGR